MPPKFLPGNRLELLENGDAFFPALIAAVDAAQHEVHLQTYIFEDDATGRSVAAALARAARRGVSVCVVADGFGARQFSRTLMPALAADGVRVLLFREEIARFRMSRQRLRRQHRKLALVDRRIAFVGGINIIDDYNTSPQPSPRFDYAVRIEGPLLAPLYTTVNRLWQIVLWANFKRRYRRVDPLPVQDAVTGDQAAALVIRDNLRHRLDIVDTYLEAIGSARKKILIANAYFLPGLRFRHALLDAARRGVDVVILLQGRVEYRLFHYAAQALYGSLLKGGVRIFEYRRSFLHAKAAVVDEDWATVGSSNIDPFSLLMAREANIVVRDARFSGELRKSLEAALSEGSVELLPHRWQRMPLWSRLLRWTCYQLVRLAVGVLGYGGEPERH
ncbi:MAG: cardiolipin synthase ClsB [Betaproteobacteria bacterium]|nr:cardiolipin synthase ClsB [Betaproteobacteria bacterium]